MTYRTMTCLAILSGLLAAGCPASDDGGGDTGAATEGTGATTGSGSAPSTMSTSATTPGDDGMDASASGDDMVDDTADTMPPATSDATGDPTTGDPTTGDPTTGDPTTGDPTTGGNNAGPCEPDPTDDECAMCVKSMCCTQLEACAADADCTCFQDCVEKNPGQIGAIQCGGDCDVELFGEGVTADLVGCSSGPCGPACV